MLSLIIPLSLSICGIEKSEGYHPIVSSSLLVVLACSVASRSYAVSLVGVFASSIQREREKSIPAESNTWNEW